MARPCVGGSNLRRASLLELSRSVDSLHTCIEEEGGPSVSAAVKTAVAAERARRRRSLTPLADCVLYTAPGCGEGDVPSAVHADDHGSRMSAYQALPAVGKQVCLRPTRSSGLGVSRTATQLVCNLFFCQHRHQLRSQSLDMLNNNDLFSDKDPFNLLTPLGAIGSTSGSSKPSSGYE